MKNKDGMTCPNSESGGAILFFKWQKFPLEEKNSSVCLVHEGSKESREFERLWRFMTLVFPEMKEGEKSETGYALDKKITAFQDFDRGEKRDNAYKMFERSRVNSHILSKGEYKNIPETTFTNSDIVVFESLSDANMYLTARHMSHLKNFDTTDKFIVVDKRRMGCFTLSALLKADLIRYDRSFISS